MHEVMDAVSETRVYDFVTEQQVIAKAIGTTQRLSGALKTRVQCSTNKYDLNSEQQQYLRKFETVDDLLRRARNAIVNGSLNECCRFVSVANSTLMDVERETNRWIKQFQGEEQ
jgi:hypothetical protein